MEEKMWLWLTLIIGVVLFLLLTIILIYEFSQTTQNKLINDQCTNDKQCKGDLVCTNGLCSSPLLPFVPPPDPGPNPGQKCTQQNCNTSPCTGGSAYCNANNICTCGTQPPIGTPCTSNSQCDLGDYCNSDGVCEQGPQVPGGGQCKFDQECGIGYMCDYNRTCQMGTPKLQCDFTNKRIVPEQYKELNGGMSVSHSGIVSYNCYQSDMTYHSEHHILKADDNILYIQENGTLNPDSGVDSKIIARIAADKTSTFFTDEYGNSLRLFTNACSFNPCLDGQPFVFHDPTIYTDESGEHAQYQKFVLY